MKEATVLYAQWALLDQLKDGVRLIIDSDDMTAFLARMTGTTAQAGDLEISEGVRRLLTAKLI